MGRSTDHRDVKRLLVTALIASFIVMPILSQDAQDTTVTHTILWSTGELFVTISRPVPTTGANRPAAIARVERSIRNDAASIIAGVLEELPYNSFHTLSDYLADHEEAISRILQAARQATPVQSRASSDLRRAELIYRLDLFGDVVAALVEHQRPTSVTRVLGWVPGGEYTGVLIYAAEPLPHLDTGEETSAEPTLFPGIYYSAPRSDELFRLIESDNVLPEYLARWGTVGYTTDPYASEFNDRIGADPLRIMAIGLFGAHPTDLIIREEHALQLLSTEANRQLLAEGRIVVILPDTPTESEP